MSHKITKFNKEDFQLEEILDGTVDRLDHVDIIISLVKRIQSSKLQKVATNVTKTNEDVLYMNREILKRTPGQKPKPIRYNS